MGRWSKRIKKEEFDNYSLSSWHCKTYLFLYRENVQKERMNNEKTKIITLEPAYLYVIIYNRFFHTS